jgi:adenylate cyclase
MEAANLERIKRTPTENMVAYDLLLRAKNHHHRRTAEDNAQALEALDRAIELDPELAQAYAWKACVLGQAMVRGYRPRSMELLDQGLELARKSLQIDPDDSESHRLLAEILIFRRRYEEAFAHQEQAYALNPNDPRIVALRGQLLTWMGRAEEGVSWIELARRLDPYPPDLRADSLGLAQFASRRYAEAIQAYKLIGKPEAAHHANLAACHAMLDLSGETEAHRQETLRLEPKFSIDSYMLWLPYQHAKDREHHRSALGKAGFS